VTALLRFDAVSAGYGGVQALFEVGLEVRANETVALLGANGAGKTTTLRALSGVVDVPSGTIEFDGRRIETLRPHHRVAAGIAHVPEGRLIFGTLTVEENLLMGAHVVRGDKAEVRRVLDRAYDMFPILKERREQAGGTLSGGEQQTLAIARGLAANPKLLAIDEASFGLAPRAVDQIFETIAAIGASGDSILLVEQNVSRSLEVADRAYVLETGRVVFAGTAAEARKHPEMADFYLGSRKTRTPRKPVKGRTRRR